MPIFSRGFVRRRAISLATSLSVMATSFALAQDPKHHHDVRTAKDTDGHQFLFDSDLAMSSMNRSMLMTPTRYIDRDFIDMTRAEPWEGHNDDEPQQLAERIASRQEQEISIMQRALPAIVSAMPSSGAHAAPHAAN